MAGHAHNAAWTGGTRKAIVYHRPVGSPSDGRQDAPGSKAMARSGARPYSPSLAPLVFTGIGALGLTGGAWLLVRTRARGAARNGEPLSHED